MTTRRDSCHVAISPANLRSLRALADVAGLMGKAAFNQKTALANAQRPAYSSAVAPAPDKDSCERTCVLSPEPCTSARACTRTFSPMTTLRVDRWLSGGPGKATCTRHVASQATFLPLTVSFMQELHDHQIGHLCEQSKSRVRNWLSHSGRTFLLLEN